MASIRRREWTSPKGRKQTRWQVDFRDALNRRKSKQFATKAEARRFAEETDLRSVAPEPTTKTVEDACTAWIERGKAQELERSTIVGYTRVVDLYIVPYLGHIALAELTSEQINTFRQEIAEKKSKSAARRAVHILKMILTYVEDWTGRNPGRKVRSTQAVRHALAERRDRVNVMTLAEARKILAACDRKTGGGPPRRARRNRLMLMLLMETGMRPSEVRGLSWGQVKLAARKIEISQRADAWGEIGACKTKAAYRDVEISKILASELEAWSEICPDSKEGLVFPTSTGMPVSHRNMLREFYNTQIAAGVTKFVEFRNGERRKIALYKLYDIRHFRASWWIFQGIDLKRVTTWLGHSSIQVTFDVYGHIIKDAEAEEVLRTALEDVLYAGATWLQHGG